MKTGYIHRILERFRNSLSALTKNRERLESRLQRLFDALTERGFRVTTSTDALLSEIRDTERRINEASTNLLWLLDQSTELTRVASLITSSLQLKQVLEEVMDTVIMLTSAERAYIMLRDPDTGEMFIESARNWERESISEEEVVFSRQVVSLAIERGESITTANAADDERFEGAESIISHNLRSILCVPLHYHGEITGVLYADNPIQRGIFRPDSLPIMEAFAQQTAIAIENARLYHRLETLNVQLEEANRLKSEFLGVVSHEMKTPFSNIGFALEVFPRYGMDNLPDEQREVWDDLVRGVKQAESLVSGLVAYAGLLSKQGTLNHRVIDVATLLDDVLLDVKALAGRRNIAVSLQLASRPVKAVVDPERFSEALFHLVQNGVQYNNDGGFVQIRAGVHRGWLTIQVKDNGPGIPLEDQDRIWLAFEQMSDAVKRGIEGLGIGLPLVRYVAQAHGGTATVESAPGQGSTFTLNIPALR
jgi:signal transduction histidine kinase